ncbi:MAG: hypothetical protein GY716_20915 [bacterium]|nr:hypothetical protein [bacterium]
MKRLLSFAAALLMLGLGLGAAQRSSESRAPSGDRPPVGLDLEFVAGVHAPIPVAAGETFFVDSMTLRTAVFEGGAGSAVKKLREQSAFRRLDWTGLELERRDFLPNPDGTWELEQFFYKAGWMGGTHQFTVVVRDAAGRALSDRVEIESTPEWPAPASEAFATRRFATLAFGHDILQWANPFDAHYSAESWAQFRNGVPGDRTFVIPRGADRLEVMWNQMPGHVLNVPLQPVTQAAWDYGFDILVDPSPPANGAYHVPGETVGFRLTFTDGQGSALHEAGSLPTYADFVSGQIASGLQYYNFFPAIVYYRDKNREGVLLASFAGPSHRVRQTHEAIPLSAFLEQDVQVGAETEEHGYSNQWQIVPPAPVVFGGPGVWSTPVSDTVEFEIPPDALPGRYDFAIKARRVFLGQESLATTVVSVEVGDPALPLDEAVEPLVGNCESCHEGIFDLSRMLHYNGDTDTCTSCHLPLGFETNNLLPYRIHRIHWLAERYTESRRKCGVCHLNPTPEVEDNARWLVCTGCHDPFEAHDHLNYAGDLSSCADFHCHHAVNEIIHDHRTD